MQRLHQNTEHLYLNYVCLYSLVSFELFKICRVIICQFECAKILIYDVVSLKDSK